MTSPPESCSPAWRCRRSLSFFTPAEVAVAAPLLDLLLGQDGEPRVPVLELIDTRLASGETDGWHYDDLPEDGDAWRATPGRASTRTPEHGYGARLRRTDRRSSRPG